jgi:hypothetical protein
MVALSDWQTLDGWAMSRGLGDLEEMEVSRFVNLVWYWMIRNAEDQKDIEKLRLKLWVPPKNPRVPVRDLGPWSAENETKAFKALKTALTR